MLTDCEATQSCAYPSKTFASLWITHTAFGPPLASFSILQFLWVWNDLIVALYMGPNEGTDPVFPIRLEKQLGTFRDQLHLLNASAVLSGFEWRWHRRSSGHHLAAFPYRKSGRRRHLDQPLFHLAAEGFRL